jgi:hypothetical protein
MMRKYDLAVADYRKVLPLNVEPGTRKYITTALNELGATP